MNLVENNYLECTIDPREMIQTAKNHTIELETLQLHDWKQKLLLNKEKVTHNYIEIHKFPSYGYDYTDRIPLYINFAIYFNVASGLFGTQLQQELTTERGDKYLHHRFYEELKSLKATLESAIKRHIDLGNEVEAMLFPDFGSLLDINE
ncbi:hypothetical protein [Legionella rowbothamii]|uniref:hypothetical protein n=1 Tax=Legionella rowbothamii TaxID=96229 RepID=UPI001055EDBB|nr:hypothetical protein [Legionella rowbothamii]